MSAFSASPDPPVRDEHVRVAERDEVARAMDRHVREELLRIATVDGVAVEHVDAVAQLAVEVEVIPA